LHRYPELELLPRGGLVHRLDKDTSGLLVVAATMAAHVELVRALAERRIRRGYLALAEGRMVAGRTIDVPIGRDPHHRTRQAVREDGRRAVTHVRVRERFRAHTLVHAELETGRTHQIRVHMASIGHPLAGDRRYGARGRLPPRPAAELVLELRAFERQALHAAELAFEHPLTGVALAFDAPVPADIEALLGALRRDADA
jgi:23S rRNA pseudouridine1911/1915/1917 synthase